MDDSATPALPSQGTAPGSASPSGSTALFWLLEGLGLALLVGLAWDRVHPRVVFPLLAGVAIGLLSRALMTAMSVPRTRLNVILLAMCGTVAVASTMLLQWRAEAAALNRASQLDQSPRHAALSALVGQSLPDPAALPGGVPLPLGNAPAPSPRATLSGKPFDWHYGLSTRWPAAPSLGWLAELAAAAATIALIAAWPATWQESR